MAASKNLMDITKNSLNFASKEFEASVSILGKLIGSPDVVTTEASVTNFVQIYDSLLSVESDVLERSEADTSSTTKWVCEIGSLMIFILKVIEGSYRCWTN